MSSLRKYINNLNRVKTTCPNPQRLQEDREKLTKESKQLDKKILKTKNFF